MNYLIDTCVISELRKPEPQNSVLAWFQSCDAEKIYLSTLSIGELHYGISILPDSRKKSDLVIWFNRVLDGFSEKILPVSGDISIIWGNMRAKAQKNGRLLPVIDGLLAATAVVHHLVLVTRNTADVEITGTPILNPWKE